MPRKTSPPRQTTSLLPRLKLEDVGFYVGLTGLVAFAVLEWPIAAVIGAGHYLARHTGAQKGLGEALEEA